MMELLAYVYLNAAWELPESSDRIDSIAPIDPRGFVAVGKFVSGLKDRKLSSCACLNGLAIALTLSILSLARQAIALELGDSGSAVRCVQSQLKEAGYFNEPITGYYGKLTEEAVLRFELDSAGVGDGILQPSTVENMGCAEISTMPVDSGVFSYGSSGTQVAELQRHLKAIGYFKAPVTAYYGRLTEKAVMQFQQANQLQIDGIVGSATIVALQGGGGILPKTGTLDRGVLYRGSRGTAVTELQSQLIAAGYYDGPLSGYYGALTEAAVMRLQRDRGLPIDGVANSTTQELLVASR